MNSVVIIEKNPYLRKEIDIFITKYKFLSPEEDLLYCSEYSNTISNIANLIADFTLLVFMTYKVNNV